MSSSSQEDWLDNIPWARYAVSLATKTDSTASHIPGPGRVLGSLLSRTGRRIEPVLTRTAESLGFGPGPLLRRLLTLIVKRHNDNCNLDAENLLPSVEGILDLAHYACHQCKGLVDFAINDAIRPTCRGLLVKLLQYLRQVKETSKMIFWLMR